MAEMLQFELVSPQKLLKSEAVEMVVVPGGDGDIGVLPNHSPLISTLRPGTIDIHESGKIRESIFVCGGFCEVSPERCTVLAEEAMTIEELKQIDAEARLSAANNALASVHDEERAKAETEVRIAEAMVIAVGD